VNADGETLALKERLEGRTLVRSQKQIQGGVVMHAVVRMYSGAGGKKLIDLLEERKKEVEALIRPVKGFVSYSLIRTPDGGASVTVCQDKAGTDESLRVAREWIAKNASNTGASAPTVLEGSVILQLS
jgi:hypothetical protein